MRPDVGIDDRQLQKWLEALRFDDKKVGKFARLVGGEMVYRTEERFSNQVDLNRSPWLPSKRAIAQGGKTLQDKGQLIGSLNFQTLPDGVKWGTSVVYARMMHYGGKKSVFPHLWGDIPARPFLGMNDDDKTEVMDIVNKLLSES